MANRTYGMFFYIAWSESDAVDENGIEGGIEDHMRI